MRIFTNDVEIGLYQIVQIMHNVAVCGSCSVAVNNDMGNKVKLIFVLDKNHEPINLSITCCHRLK